MKRANRTHRSHGFSLVEVMVAVVVICVGLLGIAKMQALALSNTNTSRLRSIAAIEAASLASAMHSNRQYWGNVAAFSVNISGNPAAVVSTDGALNGMDPNAAPNPNCIDAAYSATAACNAVNLAKFDLARWWANSVQPLFPNPNVTVACPGAAGNPAPVSCTINISWSEKAVALSAAEATQEAANEAAGTPANFERPSFTLYVEP